MAKKETPKSKPVVSRIPLPISDNPLVIDLPDGQKLVIGKMSHGAVIEVATWRGTGRPDSRTSRLMLGVSHGNADVYVDESSVTHSDAEPIPTKKKFQIPSFAFKLALPSISTFVTKAKHSAKATIAKSKDLTPIESTSELNINEWIERISLEAETKATKPQAKAASDPSRTTSSPKKASKKAVSKRR